MYAGVSKVKITPGVGTELLEPMGTISTGVHDDLFARVFILKDGPKEIALLSLDLVGLDFDLLDDMRQTIGKYTGLSASQIMFHCTHNHNSPVTMRWLRQNQVRRNHLWEEELGEKIARGISIARNRLTAVKKVGVGRENVQIGINRRLFMDKEDVLVRDSPQGPVAPYVDVLKIVTEKETSIVLFTHAAHPVSVHNASTLFTADYPGYAIAKIQQVLGKNVFPIFLQGCCGNINSDPVAGGFAESERLGTILGEAVVKASSGIKDWYFPSRLKALHTTVNLPLQESPSYEEARETEKKEKQKYAEMKRKNFCKTSLYMQQEAVLWAEDLVKLSKEEKKEHSLPAEIQIFTLGREIAFVGLSHEIFVQYQLLIQEKSPFSHTMVFAYTNGVAAYIPTPEDFPLGGYEISEASRLYGVFPLKPETGEFLFTTVISALTELKNKEQ